jgi:hypothetical protein
LVNILDPATSVDLSRYLKYTYIMLKIESLMQSLLFARYQRLEMMSHTSMPATETSYLCSFGKLDLPQLPHQNYHVVAVSLMAKKFNGTPIELELFGTVIMLCIVFTGSEYIIRQATCSSYACNYIILQSSASSARFKQIF